MTELNYWQAACAVLAFLLVLANGRAGFWKGRYETVSECSYEDETEWLRQQIDGHESRADRFIEFLKDHVTVEDDDNEH